MEIAGDANVGNAPSHPRGANVYGVASYELDFWGKHRAEMSSATALADASVFDARTITITLEASLANTYFEILALRARLSFAHQIADSAKQVLSLVEAQAQGGIASDLDVQQQRNALATFEATIPTLQQQIDQKQHLLAVLGGQSPQTPCVAGTGTV